MRKIVATAVGLSLAGLMALAPAGAASLPTGIAAVKAAAPTDLAQVRWFGWRGGWHGGWRGGWGWRRGWGFPGAFFGGLALGALSTAAFASSYPYYGYGSYYDYGPSYGYGYSPAYAYAGGPSYGSVGYWGGGPYWGRHWGWRRWGWRRW